MNSLNPYTGKTFFSFFAELLTRLFQFLFNGLSVGALATDEVQMIALCGVAASCSILGCFLVLRRMTMLANALSHTILVGIVITYALSAYFVGHTESFGTLSLSMFLFASLGMGLLTTFLTEFLTRTVGLQEDASVGMVFSFLFAIGIVLTGLWTRNSDVGTEVVMGNIDALELGDASWVYLTLMLNILAITLFYRQFQVTTFDQNYAKTLGFSPTLYHYLLMVLVSATVIASFRAVGVLMVLALLTGPPLIAGFFTHRLKFLIPLAAIAGILFSLFGVALSRHILTAYQLPLSTAGLVVCLIGVGIGCVSIKKI